VISVEDIGASSDNPRPHDTPFPDLATQRAALLAKAGKLGWPLCALNPDMSILGLPAGILRSPGPRESWEAFVAEASNEVLHGLERALGHITHLRDEYEERAGIYEFEAGLERSEAERRALEDVTGTREVSK
jgi:hypothetical protein